MAQHVLLIIDDDKLWLKIISRFFSDKGYKVLSAATGAEGLRQAGSCRPDCILLDYHLADSDADEVCAAFRSSPVVAHIPVVIMSNDDMADTAAYTECGAASFVTKPGPMEKIRFAVENLLRHVDMSAGILEKGDIRLELDGCRVLQDSRPLAQLTVEQFRFLSLLVENTPRFIAEEHIASYVFNAEPCAEKSDAIRGLVQRLRRTVGPQVGGRIKSKARLGWGYLQPSGTIPDPLE